MEDPRRRISLLLGGLRLRFQNLVDDREIAVIWGEIPARSAAKSKQIPALDGLSATTALKHGLHLMIRYGSTGVMLVNPWDDDLG